MILFGGQGQHGSIPTGTNVIFASTLPDSYCFVYARKISGEYKKVRFCIVTHVKTTFTQTSGTDTVTGSAENLGDGLYMYRLAETRVAMRMSPRWIEMVQR